MATKAQQKEDRGLSLSPDDIRELLKDPNSWIAKLYQECAELADINEYLFIHYVISAIQAERKASVEAAAREKVYIRAEERKQQAARFDAELKPEKTMSDQLRDLKSALDVLLKTPQVVMTPVRLTAHHLDLMNNFNKQLVAQLGSDVTLKSGLNFKVPPTITPVASVSQVVAVNPVLAQQVSTTPDMQDAFALFHARATMGPLSVIKMTQAIIDHSKVDESTISFADKKELRQLVEKKLMSIDSGNPELFKQLFLNGVLSLKQGQLLQQEKNANAPTTSSLTKSPATFSVRPEPQHARRKAVEKDDDNDNKLKRK